MYVYKTNSKGTQRVLSAQRLYKCIKTAQNLQHSTATQHSNTHIKESIFTVNNRI